MPRNLTYSVSDLSDRSERQRLGDLLREVFEIDLRALDALDLWPRGYRAYAYLEGPRLVANVSVFPLPVMIAGQRVEAGGVQSVATAPSHRGRPVRWPVKRPLRWLGQRQEAAGWLRHSSLRRERSPLAASR